MYQSSIIDIISPVMAGPSSSHTAGAVRLGLLARNIYNAKPDKIIFKLYNSYASTGDFVIEGGLNMLISGNSVGAGEIEITNINKFSVKLNGKYNTLLLVYEDMPGVISAVTGVIQKDNVNIASLHCDRSGKGKDASMCICLDGELSKDCIKEISELKDMYIVRYIKKLES